MKLKLFTALMLTSASLLTATSHAACTAGTLITLAKPDNMYLVDGGGTGNGAITDVATGLMWRVCSQGQTFSAGSCSGTALTYNWKAALETAATMNADPVGLGSGYSDWRLPNVKELGSLADRSCSAAPRINITKFPLTQTAAAYWSSTPDKIAAANAWYVDFNLGIDGVGTKNTLRYVRLVRGGQ